MKFELQKWHKKAMYFILVAVVIFSSWSLFTSKPNTEVLMMSSEAKKAIRLDQAEMKAVSRLTNQETTTSKIPPRFVGNPAFKLIGYFQNQFQVNQNENRQPASVGEGK